MRGLLKDSHLIEPKESEYGECEDCQIDFNSDDLFQVAFLNSYKVLCGCCKTKLEELMREDDE